ncbi:MAG: hypothetical protein PHV45_11240 [Desulfuromonas thiophila]|nr:hypothetical protein [Desulfuromonas thiophila]
MSIRVFELFHGAVITKLLRSDRPVSLRMIETNTAESWSSYVLNAEVKLLITYSTNSRAVTRPTPARAWQFGFSKNQLRQLRKGPDGMPVFAALVCGTKQVSGDKMEICLLDSEQISRVLDLDGEPQALVVKCPNGKGQLRVVKERTEEFLVPRNRIDQWHVPGS